MYQSYYYEPLSLWAFIKLPLKGTIVYMQAAGGEQIIILARVGIYFTNNFSQREMCFCTSRRQSE